MASEVLKVHDVRSSFPGGRQRRRPERMDRDIRVELPAGLTVPLDQQLDATAAAGQFALAEAA